MPNGLYVYLQRPDGSLGQSHVLEGSVDDHLAVMLADGRYPAGTNVVHVHDFVNGDPPQPTDTHFSTCWVWDAANTRVVVDMVKARAQRQDEIRAMRDVVLAASDADVLRAMGQGDTTTLAALNAARQTLRDLPVTVASDVAAITNPDALATYVPAALASAASSVVVTGKKADGTYAAVTVGKFPSLAVSPSLTTSPVTVTSTGA